MYCNKCNKAPATIRILRIQNNQVIEAHYCANCANEKSATSAQNQQNPFDPMHIVEELIGDQTELLKEVTSGIKTCAKCGLTYSKFKEIGKFGCPECYDTFKDELQHLLRRVHGSCQHCGKSPSQSVDFVEKDKKIWELRQQLQIAVKSEDYEQAARLRDMIQQVESN